MGEGSVRKTEILSVSFTAGCQCLGRRLGHADTGQTSNKCLLTKHPSRLQILPTFSWFPTQTSSRRTRVRFQEPSAGLKQPQRHSITQTCAGSPLVLRRPGYTQRVERRLSDPPCPAVTSWKDTDKSPRPLSVMYQLPGGL